MGRGYFVDNEDPRYRFELCVSAREYFSIIDTDGNDLGTILRETDESDKAVLVTPLNEAAQSMLRGEDQEYWHYSGECSDLTLGVPLEITESEAHCSDVGPTKYMFLGDFTIKEVRVVTD
tara:strand:+ start:704 stop:1063 length:360 start_codon:yes stop_codon:yes gene_type:complete